MKRKIIFGVLAFLLVLQAQTVFADCWDFIKAFESGNYSRAERILKNEISKYNIDDRSFCFNSIIKKLSGNEMAKWLDIFPNVNNRFGEMPYFSVLAGNGNNMDAINYLLSKNIMPSLSCVDLGLRKGNSDILKLFLRNSGDIDKREYSNNKTMLMVMAEKGHSNSVRILVENGAKINLRDNNGATAASLAYDNGEIEIYNYLKEHGAIDFEPRQAAAQPASPAQSSSTTDVYVQPSTPSQSTQAPAQSASTGWNLSVMAGANNIGGTWNSSVGKGNFMVLNGNGTSGTVNVQVNGKYMSGTAAISGNTLDLYITSGEFKGQQFRYTIVTNKLIQGDGENFSR